MQDKELYERILGIESPWTVSDVSMDVAAHEICVRLEHARGERFKCPECEARLPCHDHAEERRWRHLDSCQFKTIVVARVPRVNCPDHGVKTISVPWAEKGNRFTILFERFALDVVLATQTIKGACRILRTTWDETWRFVERAVARGQDRKQSLPMPRIGIDEKAFTKGHSYVTMICDIDHGTVEAIAEGNDANAAKACFSRLSESQIGSVEAIAMDMSGAYVKAAKESLPLAESKIVHDRFHVMQQATKAVDKVRKAEHKRLVADGDERLKGTKYVWLTSQEHLSDKQRLTLDEVYHTQLQTGKAWAFKEMLRDLWHHDTAEQAIGYFKEWYKRVIHTKLEPMKKVARMIQERLANVVSYCTHRITNAVAEGLNSKIMGIKRRVGGFRNIGNFKTAIYFYCGGLDLHPR